MRYSRNVSPRKKRHLRVRGRVNGTPERPRLNVFRSAQHIYAQVIDDTQGHTLASASTLDATLREGLKETRRVDEARQVGKLVGERARAAGITKVVFDRGGWLYHGRIKSLAEGARESGLEF
ncbi:MAG: 50S ribosomal protein L18 [Chloroflexota bacterium]|nr:50S ribosomal protein L18 [Chloroflexota bacterium]